MEAIDFKKIEEHYPYPIATTFRRARTIDNDAVELKHDAYEYVFEITLKYLAILCLMDYHLHYPSDENYNRYAKFINHENKIRSMKITVFPASQILIIALINLASLSIATSYIYFKLNPEYINTIRSLMFYGL